MLPPLIAPKNRVFASTPASRCSPGHDGTRRRRLAGPIAAWGFLRTEQAAAIGSTRAVNTVHIIRERHAQPNMGYLIGQDGTGRGTRRDGSSDCAGAALTRSMSGATSRTTS
jgi:hypothetical protein